MKKILFLITFTLCVSSVFGQNHHKIDSLKQILKSLPETDGTDADTTRLALCLDIGILYSKTQPDSAMFWYNLVADTLFDAKKIKKHLTKARLIGNALFYSGQVFYYIGNYPLAVNKWKQSLKIREELDDKAGISNCLMSFGVVARNQGDYLIAIDYYERSIKIKESLGDRAGIALCFVNMGNVAVDQGNYPEAIEYYEHSMKISAELNNRAGVSRCLNNLGVVMRNQGDYRKAKEYYKRSLKIDEELGNRTEVSKCLNNLGNVAADQGDNPQAIDYYERSLKIKEELGDRAGISVCLMNLGIVEKSLGNYPQALDYYEQSLKIKEEIVDRAGISLCLMNLGVVASVMGDYSQAMEYYERSLKIFEELGDKAGISLCLTNLGIVVKNQGNSSQAMDYYKRSLKIEEELSNKAGISLCLSNMGVVAGNLEDYPQALEYLKKSLKICEELGDKEGISGNLNNLGLIALEQGNYSIAVDYFDRSIQLLEEQDDKANLASGYSTLANALVKQNKSEKAMTLFLKSQEITMWLLQNNFTILSEGEKMMYLDKTKAVFNDINSYYINYLTRQKKDDSLSGICYNNELVLKGLLLKSTSAVMDVVYNSNDSIVKEAFWLLKQYRDQISSLQGTEIENRDSVIANLEKLANEQERTLVKLSSEFADIQNLFNYKWEDVQKNLNRGEAAIEFISFTQGDKNDTIVYAALIIHSDCQMPVSVKLFEESELQKILGKSTGTSLGNVNSIYIKNSTALYNLIWKPLESSLTGIQTVYFAPVGVLNKISFAALSKEPGITLCDKYNLQQVSTTGKLIGQEKTGELKMTAAVFGGIDYNPDQMKSETWNFLPGTLNEKNSIENQFKKNKIACLSYSGKEAKEETFKALFDSTDAPSILHVSTHGFFFPDPEVKQSEKQNESEENEVVFRGSSGFGNWMFVNNKNPMMRSGLVFAGANRVWSEDWGRTDNEGVLTAYEVSNLNMRNTDLVVLSACETGLGDIKGSEGVYGLQRAFKMAGVKYIIMSLWQVPDKETVEFMELFYKKLLKSKDVRKSFNETQKEMRKKYDPYYWAAFVLVE